MPPSSSVYVPTSRGRAALAELDRVAWDRLAHAYGTGTPHQGLDYDVAGSLRRLGDEDEDAISEAVDALFSNVCHQGTIYEATAYAVPFLAAFAAGNEITTEDAVELAVLLAQIAIASSFEAPHGSHAGAWGHEVAPRTRDALRLSQEHLVAFTGSHSSLAQLGAALESLSRADTPRATEAAASRLQDFLDGLDEG